MRAFRRRWRADFRDARAASDIGQGIFDGGQIASDGGQNPIDRNQLAFDGGAIAIHKIDRAVGCHQIPNDVRGRARSWVK